jgi:hypothetical protein
VVVQIDLRPQKLVLRAELILLHVTRPSHGYAAVAIAPAIAAGVEDALQIERGSHGP